MLIFGVDPGLARTGWAVIEKRKSSFKALDYGCLMTKREMDEEQRLLLLYQKIKKLLKKYQPKVLALEKIFFTKNAKTAFSVGQARGIILLASASEGIPTASYTPLEVKLAITGYGKAEKSQMQKMIKSILKLAEAPKPDDTADALAVALTHCFNIKLKQAKSGKLKRIFFNYLFTF